LIDIKSLNFAYEANPNTPIFKALDLLVQTGDKVIIRGRSGSGKTTLYKLLTSAYPAVLNLVE
jgi:ABC-type multidrug transport system fused ATPase/permease subunit